MADTQTLRQGFLYALPRPETLVHPQAQFWPAQYRYIHCYVEDLKSCKGMREHDITKAVGVS